MEWFWFFVDIGFFGLGKRALNCELTVLSYNEAKNISGIWFQFILPDHQFYLKIKRIQIWMWNRKNTKFQIWIYKDFNPLLLRGL